MRILYLTQWFEPEPNIIKGLAFVEALQRAGHEVTVVTGFPNYPTGKLYPGYRLRAVQRETIGGVRVIRLAHYLSHDASSARRSLNFLTFFLSVLAYLVFRRERYDLAYVYHPPITVGLAAGLAGRVRRLPFVLDVQDLWPDTVAASGMSGARRLARILGPVCRFVYRRAAAIVAQSEGIRRKLIERQVPPEKVVTIRNWADLSGLEDARAASSSRPARHRLRIVYAGNFGRAQGLETVVNAAVILQREGSDLEILLYGDGIETESLKERATRSGLNLLAFRPRIARAEIARILQDADALLLHLRDEPLFAMTIPSKTQFYLAMGRPMIAGVAGETAELLDQSGAALVATPGNPEALARAIQAFTKLSPEQRQAMGVRARRFYDAQFSFQSGMARTIQLVEGIHAGKAGPSRAAKL